MSSGKKSKEPTSDNSKDAIAYQCLLKNELLGAGIEDVKEQAEERKIFAPLASRNLFSVSLFCLMSWINQSFLIQVNFNLSFVIFFPVVQST